MPGSGQFVEPVQVEVTSDIGAEVQQDGLAPTGNLLGLATLIFDQANNLLFVPRSNAAGQMQVDVVALPPPTPGATIQSVQVAVGIGATVAVAVPANVYAINVQNVGGAGTLIAVREQGGAALTGMYLPRYGIFGFDKAVANLELQELAGIATAVNITYEMV